MTEDPFASLYARLEQRYLADFSFAEIRRAVQALSVLYVQRRSRLSHKSGLDSAGKRAAFGLYFASLHFLSVGHVVGELGYDRLSLSRLLDLGCGTGLAGAAWALELGPDVLIQAVDRNGWAATEARWVLKSLGLWAKVTQTDLNRVRLHGSGSGILCAYTANELPPEERGQLMRRLLGATGRGAAVLVVEPIATGISGWMDEWVGEFQKRGGRSDEWRFRPVLPDRLALLDRAAGLNHRTELTCRSLSVSNLSNPAT